MFRRTSYEFTPCPVCGTDGGIEIADSEMMRRELELLWAFHERRLKAGIPPEQLTDRLAFSQDPPLRLTQCQSCEHIYRNPWEREVTLKAAYARAAPATDVLRGLFESQRRSSAAQVHRLTETLGRVGRGLEVGSYTGGFLAAAAESGWQFEGVDVNPDTSALLRERGLRVTDGEISDVETSQTFDAIAIWNTFEQLYDGRSALQAARRLVGPGGILALRVPNGAFFLQWHRRLGGALSSLAVRMLAHNNLLGFPYRQGFTERSIRSLLEQFGFQVVRVFGDALHPVADDWTTRFGRFEQRVVQALLRIMLPGWRAPWVEIYARRTDR